MSDFGDSLRAAFGADRIGDGVPLAPFTTFRVGGPAEWFFETRSSEEIARAVGLADAAGQPVTMIGGGSNVLISDAGVRGLVIRTRGGFVSRIAPNLVRADAAVSINGLVRWTINHGCAGVEAWAGTPGTIGGAIYGNAHFGGRLIGDLVVGARLLQRGGGDVMDVSVEDLGFGYDRSRLQETGEVLLTADFRVHDGEPAALRATARESLSFRKRTQPLDTHNAGCVFQNPQPSRDIVPEGIPWSAGALVDRAGMKGVSVGGARVSPAHGNFIVNEDAATARDIRRLIELCRDRVRERFGVELREEIVYVGDFR